jgi:aspartate kinase
VDGVFSADPRLVPGAERLDQVSYTEMGELARCGAQVLNAQAVAWAEKEGIVVWARHASGEGAGTRIQAPAGRGVQGRAVSVALLAEAASLHLKGEGPLQPLLAQLSGATPQEVIVTEGAVELWLSLENLHGSAALRAKLERSFPGIRVSESRCVVSAVGGGLGSSAPALASALEALASADLPILGVVAHGPTISVLTERSCGPEAVRRPHAALLAPECEVGQPAC